MRNSQLISNIQQILLLLLTLSNTQNYQLTSRLGLNNLRCKNQSYQSFSNIDALITGTALQLSNLEIPSSFLSILFANFQFHFLPSNNKFILMSSSPRKSFFREYAKSGYLSKINPEFEGIAKKFYQQKREHDKVHSTKKKLDKEVAYMQRMQLKMEQQLSKKQLELKYTVDVTNRFHSDIRRKQWLHQYLENEKKVNKQRAEFIKSENNKKIEQAKQFMTEQKRSLANINRSQNQKVKEERSLKRAQEWDNNKSRASVIYQLKKDIKDNTNKFYQSKNSQSLKTYQTRIKSYKKFTQDDSQKIKQLEDRLMNLNSKYSSTRETVDGLNKQIDKIRKEVQLENSLVRSRLRSRSSSSLSAYSAGRKPSQLSQGG